MQGGEVLADAIGRIRQAVHRVLDGLDAEALAHRPDPEANSIAWLVWHLTRVEDDHVAEIAGRDQAWTEDGWAARFDLPFDPEDTGYGHDADQVAAVRPDGPDLLKGYHDVVADRTLAFLDSVEAADLDRIVDRRWDPPVTAGVRLVSVLGDAFQHVGQAAYVRGLYERRTT